MMNKKVIKQFYSDIVSKEAIRPIMTGVYFEKDWCAASDTHVLVVYNESDPRFEGKIISATGEEIKGKYPNVKRVIPADNIDEFKGDLYQLTRALNWWVKQENVHEDDQIVFGKQGFMIRTLRRILNLLSLTAEFQTAKMYLGEKARPCKIVSENFTSIAMPVQFDEAEVDSEREDGCSTAVSYANLINTFALESSKPKVAKPAKYDWL